MEEGFCHKFENPTNVGEEGGSFSDIRLIGQNGIVLISCDQTPETYRRAKKIQKSFVNQGEILDKKTIFLLEEANKVEKGKELHPELLVSVLEGLELVLKAREQIQKSPKGPLHELTSDVLRQQNIFLQEIVQNFLQKELLNQIDFLEQTTKENFLKKEMLNQIDFLEQTTKENFFRGKMLLGLMQSEMSRVDIVVGVLRNILSRLEREVFSLHDKDEELIKEFVSQISGYKDFSSTLNHDYRLLLGNMFEFASLIEEDEENEEIDEYKKIVSSAPEKLQEMLYCRMALLKDPNYKLYKTSDIIKDSVAQLNGKAIAKTIIIKNEGGTGGELFCDKGRTDVWLHAFLINAVKFTPDGGKIIITSKKIENGYTKISVKDAGTGMSLERLKKLQKMFLGEIKIEKLKSQKGVNGERGTGYGLVNCQELCKKLVSATLEVESKEGVGSTFSFVVPATEEKHNEIIQEGEMKFKRNRKHIQSNIEGVLTKTKVDEEKK